MKNYRISFISMALWSVILLSALYPFNWLVVVLSGALIINELHKIVLKGDLAESEKGFRIMMDALQEKNETINTQRQTLDILWSGRKDAALRSR